MQDESATNEREPSHPGEANVQRSPSDIARAAYLSEPAFDQDAGLSDEDKVVADSFPASDPPAMP
jgi:hypothetical protein